MDELRKHLSDLCKKELFLAIIVSSIVSSYSINRFHLNHIQSIIVNQIFLIFLSIADLLYPDKASSW